MHVPTVKSAIDRNYDGPIRICVTLGPWEQDQDGPQLVQLVEDFLRLGDLGVFARSRVHPADSVMRPIATHHAPPVQYVWDVDMRRVDPRFVQVFRNQMLMFSAVFCPVLHVTIEMLQPSRPLPPSAVPLLDSLAVEQGQVYPQLSQNLAIPITYEGAADYQSNRRAEVELSGSITDEMLETIREWFDLWARTLDCGYSSTEDRLQTGKCAIFDASTDILDVVTFETHIGTWGAPECAWDGYLNLVGRVDRDIGHVVAARIY